MAAPRPGCVLKQLWPSATSRTADLSHPRNVRRIYNVVDDDPAPRSEVSAFADALLRGEQLPSKAAPLAAADAPALRLGLDEKRVRNSRLKDELGVALRFPDYRAGITALNAGDRTPFA